MGWEEVARRLPYPKKGRIRSRDVVLRPVSEFGGPIPPSIFGSFSSFRGFGEFSSAFFNEFHVAKFMHDFEFGSGIRAYC